MTTTDEKKTDINKSSNMESKTLKARVSVLQLFQYATLKEKLLIFIAVLLSILSGAIKPLSVILYGNYITKITFLIQQNQTDDLQNMTKPLIGMMMIMGTMTIVAGYFSSLLWIRTGEAQIRRIKSLYLRSVLNQDMCWFDNAKEGSLSIRLSSDTQLLQEGISEKYGLCILLVSQFISGFIVAFYTDYKMSLITLSTFPLLGAICYLLIRFAKKYAMQAQFAYGKASTVVEQALQSIRTVYSFTLQARFLKLYEAKLKENYRFFVKQNVVLGGGVAFFMLFFFSSLALALWYGAHLVQENKSTGASVLIVFLSMVRGCTSLTDLPGNLTPVITACGVAHKIFEIIDQAPTIIDGKTKMIPSQVKGAIDLNNVVFSYPSRPDICILKNISIHISPGTTVAFVGSSGSGKSTITQLIQRLYDPEEGSITLDGIDLRDLNVKWLRETIGIVNQEPVLFNTTIRQNILMGSRPEKICSEKEMIWACKEANCHEFISQLPMGYDTIVGDQGCMLSGGQKQRIAIARAILKNPSILILDEATSALDMESESQVQNALDQASVSRTTIVIAHRLTTVMNADMIFVLEQGKIMEYGKHQELIEKRGLYSQLVNNQLIHRNRDTNGRKDSNMTVVQDSSQRNFKNNDDIHQSQDSLLSDKTGDSKHTVFEKVIDKEYKNLPFIKQKKKATSSTLKTLRNMRPEWPMMAAGALGAILEGCILPLYAYSFSTITAVLYNPVHFDQSQPVVFQGANMYSFILVIVGITAFIGSGLNSVCFSLSEGKYAYRLRHLLFATYMKQEVGFFDTQENNIGSLTKKLATDALDAGKIITRVWSDLIVLMSALIVGLSIAFVHSWELSLIVFGMALVIAAANAYDTQVEKRFQEKMKLANTDSNKIAVEAIREARTVTRLNRQHVFEKLYHEATEYPHQLAIKKAYFSCIGFALLRGITIYTNAVGFYAGARLITNGNINFQQLFTSITVLMTAAEKVGQKLTFASNFARGKAASLAVDEILDRPLLIDDTLEGLEPESIKGNFKLQDVAFAYPSRPNAPVFNGDFHLEGRAGQTIALVGPSGCGKSTTIGMMQRWYDPVKGTVSLDDHNVKSYSVYNLRQHQALVSQEPILFDMSIGENIRFGIDEHKQVTQEQVEEACRAANIHSFIASLPDGYDTRVGDKGSQLSGGQKQRIAIARALIRKPKVLLLDEATSALDSESERLVQEALDNILQEGGRTTITIAHRLSTIKNADLICVVKDGQVIEQGTHFELLELNGIYSDMVQKQSLDSN
ncbi:P-loop containing nucleoside triphosphate hydrolase protein [Gilbertella persicaria]|uniref:P-loop containing nucleoside triphosphate hydrolase protein n=1 Tax=Gilbertella persicaria TaxID=101096 RepID=UPI00222070A4|nr:P-loop containing nucleoside triphosphate hydrolase protein [Gilbertella persicaria]KAI8077273.1 P-loop containing nucleoside triphosphate hydrolase protein [Gilbertella persicaria]